MLRSLKRLERKRCGSQVNSESNQESDPNVVYKFTCHPESGFNLTCVSWWSSSLFKPEIVYKCKSNPVAVLVMSPMHQEVRIWLPTSPASRRPCWPPFRHYPPTRTAEPLQVRVKVWFHLQHKQSSSPKCNDHQLTWTVKQWTVRNDLVVGFHPEYHTIFHEI